MIKKRLLIIYLILSIILSSSLMYSLNYDYSGKYAPPYNVFENNKPLFNISPESFDIALINQDYITININVTNQGGYVYKKGYYSDFQTGRFIAFDFPQQTLGNTSWIINRAYKTINISKSALVNGQTNAIIIFSCKKYNGEWRCGCDDNTGRVCNQWQIQAFNVQNTINNPCPLTPCSPGIECVDGFCVNPQCIDNEYRTCTIGSCEGTQKCENQAWQECILSPQQCTIGACTGKQTCSNGVLGACIRDDPSCTGSGTIQDPYLITTCQEIQNISNNLEASYILANNVNCSETRTWNSGKGFMPLNFSGVFNGNNYSITNLYINRPDTDYVGFFGKAIDMNVSNLNMLYINITGHMYVGGVMGYDLNSGVYKVFASGDVYAFTRAGGIIGEMYSLGNISEVGSSVNVIATSNYAGGVAGTFTNGEIYNSYATGNITGAISVGGLTGGNFYGKIYNSYATGKVNGKNYVGGLISHLEKSNVSYSFSTGPVYAENTAKGGLIGGAGDDSNIYFSYWNNNTENPDYCYLNGSKPANNNGCIAIQNNEAYFKTFSNPPLSSWDQSIWAISSSKNNGYPYLKWQNL